MVRTQVQLSAEQHRQLRRWARRLGVSMSEVVRRCVADRLAHDQAAPSREELRQAAIAVCGRYRDPGGSSRVAVEHDRHLAEAYRR